MKLYIYTILSLSLTIVAINAHAADKNTIIAALIQNKKAASNPIAFFAKQANGQDSKDFLAWWQTQRDVNGYLQSGGIYEKFLQEKLFPTSFNELKQLNEKLINTGKGFYQTIFIKPNVLVTFEKNKNKLNDLKSIAQRAATVRKNLASKNYTKLPELFNVQSILVALAQTIEETALTMLKGFENEVANRNSKAYLIAASAIAGPTVFNPQVLFETKASAVKTQEQYELFNKWNTIINLVEDYYNKYGGNDTQLKNALTKLKDFSSQLISTTKFLSNAVFSKPVILSGTETDRAQISKYKAIETSAGNLKKELDAIRYFSAYKKDSREIIAALAHSIEIAAKRLYTASSEEVAKRKNK